MTEETSYRATLVAAEQKQQDAYDTTLVSLSGGALGVSFLFVEHIVGDKTPIDSWALITAWIFWALSLSAVVFSYFTSRLALRKAIQQCDVNDFTGGVGGAASKITYIVNAFSGILFLVGVGFVIYFSSKNIGVPAMAKEIERPQKEDRGYIPTPKPLTEGIIPPPPPAPPQAPPPKEEKGA